MKISVCVATYNGSAYIRELLVSVLAELVEGDEVLVSDDFSSDNTTTIVREFGVPVRLIATSRAGGVVQNFERVVSAATGDCIVLCDQDDVWLPGRVDLIRGRLRHCDLVMLNGAVVDSDLRRSGQNIFTMMSVRSGFFENLKKNSFVGCCMAFRREVRDMVVPFPAWVPWHDWYIGLVAELTGDVERINEVTLLYRRHGGNFSPTGEKSRYPLWKKILIRLAVLRAVLVVVLFRRRVTPARSLVD